MLTGDATHKQGMVDSPSLSKLKRDSPAHCLCIHPWQSPSQNTTLCPSVFSSDSGIVSSHTKHFVWLALDFFSVAFGGVWWSGRFHLVLFGQVEIWVAMPTVGSSVR